MSTPSYSRIRYAAVALAVVLGLNLSACRQPEPAPPATPSETPAATVPGEPAPAAPPGAAPTTAPAAPAPAVPGAPAAAPSPAPGPTAAVPGAAPGAPAAPTAAGPGPVNPGKLLPVDEAKRAPGLADFRARLQQAVKERDKETILNALAPNVGVTGGQQGVDAFRQAWDLDNPNSRFWQEFGNVLRQGGTFGTQGGNNVFYAPHVYGRLPQGLDPSQYGVISGERVNVRKEPSLSAPTVGQLTYEIVKLAPNPSPKTETIEGETHPWVAITMPDGATGYVYGRYIRSPQGLHARFERIGDEWKVTYFGEGQ